MSLELLEASKGFITHPVTIATSAFYIFSAVGLALYNIPRAEQGLGLPTYDEKNTMDECQEYLRLQKQPKLKVL